MQIRRLFEIVYILLDKEKVYARELADHFEVSSRTIYRDVEILSQAGIPIYMTKGKGGGISLLPDFVLNKAVLTDSEKTNILSALQGLNTVDGDSVNTTLSKLGLLFGSQNTSFIEIDYSDWGCIIKTQFETAKTAILSRRLLGFDYVSSQSNATRRTVEPYVLWFKDKTWYLKCFCLDKKEFRTFRLSRMRHVFCLEEHYIPRKLETGLNENQYYFSPTKIVLNIDQSQRYRVYDDFPDQDVTEHEDGSFTVTMNFSEDEWLYGYILSFGCFATVMEPEHVRTIITGRLKKSLEHYL